jgi:hypothetical protein
MKRFQFLSGALAFSFPCLVGAGLTLPCSSQAQEKFPNHPISSQQSKCVSDADSDSLTYPSKSNSVKEIE